MCANRILVHEAVHDAFAVLDEARLEEGYSVPMEGIDWRGKRLFIAGGSGDPG